MILDRLLAVPGKPRPDNAYWTVVADENFFRLYLVSVVVLLLEMATVAYVALVIGEVLYLPYVIAVLCIMNIAAWLLHKRRPVETQFKRAIVYFTIVIALTLGGTWNAVMRGTPVAISLYMFMVFFVAAAFIVPPLYSLLLFVGAECLFIATLLLYPSEGLLQAANVINSILFVSLGWTISFMLFQGHQRLYRDKLLIQETNRQLERLSITDRLTGIYNRHKLEEALEQEVQRFETSGRPFAIVLTDIDNFKAVNDQYGHQEGDRALCVVSEAIGQCLRRTDILGRWGGEEFLVICPDTDLPSAYAVAERIRETVSSVPTVPRKVTLSVGVAEYGGGEILDELLRRADNRLYEAKRAGRNRVVASPLFPPDTTSLEGKTSH